MEMIRTEMHFPRTEKRKFWVHKYILLFEREVNSFYREFKGVLKFRYSLDIRMRLADGELSSTLEVSP